MNTDDKRYDWITEKIIGASFRVGSRLGLGFAEKCYGKSVKALDTAHIAQCINYVTATRIPVCLLINFGKRVEFKRIAGPSLVPETHRCPSVSIGGGSNSVERPRP